MGKKQVTSLTPGKGGVGHGIKKPITKTNNVNKTKPNKSAVKSLGLQILKSARIVSTSALGVGADVEVVWVDGNTYNAKVLKVGDGKCLVHYKGWNTKYDEWITAGNCKRKVLAEMSNIKIKQKNKAKLNVIESIKTGMKMSEDLDDNDNSDKDVENEDPEMDGLCEYEKIRLRNIREREALFAELKINEAKSDLKHLSTPTQNKKGPSKRGLSSEVKTKEVLPARKSARLSGGQVAQIERYVPLLDPPTEDQCLPMKSLSLSETFSKTEDPDRVSNTKTFLSSLSEIVSKNSSISFTSSSLKSSVSSLSITEELVAKVVPGRIFSLAIHPGKSPLIVSVGDKYGNIGLWDVLATNSTNHGVHLFQPHTKPVNCLTWDQANNNNLLSTSYDGTTRLFDTTKQEYLMIYGEQEFIDWGGWTSWHEQVSPDTFLISRGNSGTVVLVDRRVGWQSAASKFQVFDRTHAKTLSAHPVNRNLFVTGNNKCGCFIFDTRTGTKSSKLMEPTTELLGHTKSLSSCQFSQVTGNQVVTVSKDDNIRLFDTTTTPTSLTPQCRVRHNNQTGRWLTAFRSSWHPRLEGMFVMGSMERPRQIEMWGTERQSLDLVATLRGDWLGSVCSLVEVHPSMDVVVGGNSSGRVHMFM